MSQFEEPIPYPYDDDVGDLLAHGTLKLFVPPVTETKKQLSDLRVKQAILTEQMHNENLKLSWSQNQIELQEMFDLMRMYYGKLVNIKKQMRSIHERSSKLKKRAVRLQNHVEKDNYIKMQGR
ncbi:biogenesis of lysosome-related organelles complex 1 subunit 6 [Onthophagus taurus]|uniref:biogenesis of lysosome-related organelles complex 1 subunit 6 n=1 Tax=Onthophagus taurus TaxID=166361 RepID=UPI000C20E46F|nr:biogenesis of lysosome-related organelles complex 1 subunit 6-like [Onthophagus taurus]